jgi:hypothetical protein
MKSSELNTSMLDSYYRLLENLSPDNKLELISRLSRSMKTTKKTSDDSWKKLYGALLLDESADEFIDGLKRDRCFTRKSIDL